MSNIEKILVTGKTHTARCSTGNTIFAALLL